MSINEAIEYLQNKPELPFLGFLEDHDSADYIAWKSGADLEVQARRVLFASLGPDQANLVRIGGSFCDTNEQLIAEVMRNRS